MVCVAWSIIIIPFSATSGSLLLLSFCFDFLLLLFHAVELFLILLGLDLLIFIFACRKIIIILFLISSALFVVAAFSLRLGVIFISNKVLIASLGPVLGSRMLLVTPACSFFLKCVWLLLSVICNLSGAANDFVAKVVRGRLRSGIFTGLLSDLLLGRLWL